MIGRFLLLAFVTIALAPVVRADESLPAVFPKAVVVKAFIFDPADGHGVSILQNFTTLNVTAAPVAGVRLTANQINRLKRALVMQPRPSEYTVGACFEPHHGFVFEDAQGKVVGTVDVCFNCLSKAYDAPGFVERANAINARRPKTNTAADQNVRRKLDTEVEQLRAELGMPSGWEVVHWESLADLVRELGLPIRPVATDYDRLRGKAAP